MAKYLVIGSYTAQGAAGVLKEGGSGRRDAARQVIESVGGTLESIYWGFGTDDFYATVELPGHAAATAASLKISSSGAARVRTVPLITPHDIHPPPNLSP